MTRLITPGVLVPVGLAAAGVVMIVVGQRLGEPAPTSSLPPIVIPTETPVGVLSPSAAATGSRPAPTGAPAVTPEPTLTPLPDDVVAVQLQVNTQPEPINVAVKQSDSPETDDFPPDDAAFILSGGSQPGRNTNSFIFAHALDHLFKRLWNARVGDQVLVRMSNDQVLEYRITEVRPNVPCPDPNAEPHPYPPLALQRGGDDCDTSWLDPTPTEQLTLQTSQGYNRNWGELVIIAKPVS
ncbi:MAG: sortase [Chloroflexota bacterium]|nr:sortase [Chloroflexota bacterium]